MSKFDVTVTVCIRVEANNMNLAESHVLDMLDRHLGDMLESRRVLQTTVTLSPTNPRSTEVLDA